MDKGKTKGNLWTNSDNTSFYDNMPSEEFHNGIVEGGLDNGCDVKAISTYINNSSSILEVGAGTGRILRCILESGYKGNLFAVERNKKLYELLAHDFRYKDKATVICTDIRYFEANQKFDLILWMWAGICEFSPKEQIQVLAKLISFLNKSGSLIFDTIPIDCPTINAVEINSHTRIIETPFGKDYGYFPSSEEIENYAEQLNIKDVKCIKYKTKTNKIRHLNVFTI